MNKGCCRAILHTVTRAGYRGNRYQQREIEATQKRLDNVIKLLKADGIPYDEEFVATQSGMIVNLTWAGEVRERPAPKLPKLAKPSKLTLKDVEIAKRLADNTRYNGRNGAWSASDEDVIAADREYFAELERLAETRDRFKPGGDCASDDMELVTVGEGD